MIDCFDVRDVHKSPAAYNPEKLLWLNAHYIKNDKPTDVAKHLASQFATLGIDNRLGPPLSEIVTVQAERAKTLKEMTEKSRFFYEEIAEYDADAAKKNLTKDILPALQQICDKFRLLRDWNAADIHHVINETVEQLELKLGKVAQPIRVAVTGGTVSPPIDMTLFLLGKERVIERLKKAIAYIQQGEGKAAFA